MAAIPRGRGAAAGVQFQSARAPRAPWPNRGILFPLDEALPSSIATVSTALPNPPRVGEGGDRRHGGHAMPPLPPRPVSPSSSAVQIRSVPKVSLGPGQDPGAPVSPRPPGAATPPLARISGRCFDRVDGQGPPAQPFFPRADKCFYDPQVRRNRLPFVAERVPPPPRERCARVPGWPVNRRVG